MLKISAKLKRQKNGIFLTIQTDVDEQLVYMTHDKGNSWTITAKDTPNGKLSRTTDADDNLLVTYKNNTWIPSHYMGKIKMKLVIKSP